MPEYGLFAPPEQWIPVRLMFRNPTDEAVDGYAVVPITHGTAALNVRLRLQVPPRSRVVRMVHTYIADQPGGREVANEAPPTIGRWHRSDGARIARGEGYIRPYRAGQIERLSDLPAETRGTYMLLVNSRTHLPAEDSYDANGLTNFLERIIEGPVMPPAVSEHHLPRTLVGYDTCRAVIFDATDPDELDQAQRQALLDYLLAGGVLILPAPLDEADPFGTWLAPYAPVQIIGRREMTEITPLGDDGPAEPLPLREPVEVTEALPAEGTIVLREGDYVHAAYRPVGLGRVVFTSFPINALDPADPRTGDIWRELLDLARPSLELAETRLPEQRDQLLQSMIGLPTAPWAIAAGVAGGYILIVLAVQSLVGGPRRPMAFSLVMIIAIVLSIALVAMGFMQRRGDQLAGARLAVLQLSPIGGGVHQELAVYAGQDERDFTLSAARPDISLRPLESGRADPPTLDQPEFRIRDAGAYATRIETIWEARGVIPDDRRVEAVGVFGPQGLTLSIDNQFGQPLLAPLFIWNHESFRLDDLAGGRSTVPATRRNPRGDFTNVTVFATEVAKLRGDMLQGVLLPPSDRIFTARAEPAPELAAWLDDQTAPHLIRSEGGTDPITQTNALLRVPVRIDPTPPQTNVRISSAFTRLIPGEARGLPYDPGRREWIASNLDGAWNVGFAAPQEIGQLRITRATVEANVSAPQQTITIRRGQVRNGRIAEDPNGPVVARWRQPLGPQSVTFEPGPDDVDDQGRLWLHLSVESPAPTGIGQVASPWQFRDMSISFEAQVVGPPRQ